MTKFEATNKVLKIRINKSDDEVCKIIAISKPTFYIRLKKQNWKTTEISHINSIVL